MRKLICPLVLVLVLGIGFGVLAPVAALANGATSNPQVVAAGATVHLSAGHVSSRYQVDWYSDLDGYLGTGASIDVTTLSAGTHTIDFYVFRRSTGAFLYSGTTSVTVSTAPALAVLSVKSFNEDPALLSRIDSGKISLEDAIVQASTKDAPGFPIQAKLEMNDAGTQISMSIYTAKDKMALPETNPVTESSGDPTGATWTPQTDVFGGADGKTADFEHVARAAAMLNLMQTTDVSLVDAIRTASAYGTVYRVEPLAVDGRAIFNVLVKDSNGRAKQLTIDLHKR